MDASIERFFLSCLFVYGIVVYNTEISVRCEFNNIVRSSIYVDVVKM